MKMRRSCPRIELLEERSLLAGGHLTATLGSSQTLVHPASDRTQIQALHLSAPLSVSLSPRNAEVPASANQAAFRYSVSGITFATTNYVGTRIPVGRNVIAQRPVTALIFPANGQNGFNGEIQATERVLRYGRTSTFVGTSTQTFTGVVMLGGSPYTGTFTQVLRFHGQLNPNLGVDDPAQAAQNFQGTWKIVGRGTGALANLIGHGTLVWPGGMVPVSYSGRVTLQA